MGTSHKLTAGQHQAEKKGSTTFIRPFSSTVFNTHAVHGSELNTEGATENKPGTTPALRALYLPAEKEKI